MPRHPSVNKMEDVRFQIEAHKLDLVKHIAQTNYRSISDQMRLMVDAYIEAERQRVDGCLT